jgi:hypothetical protein
VLGEAERAAVIEDPWDALVELLETIAALHARDRGFFQATEEFVLRHPDLLRRHRPIVEAIDPLLARAQAAGAVRDDITTLDLLGLVKGSVACLPPSRDLRDDGWRRYLSIMLDALRPSAATPLPGPPLTYEEIEAALIGEA